MELSSVWNVDLKINNQHTRNTGRGNEDHRGRLNLADASQVHRACRRRLGVRLRRGPGLRVMRRSCGRPSAPHVAPRRRVRGQDGKSDPILDCVGPRAAPAQPPASHPRGVRAPKGGTRALCARDMLSSHPCLAGRGDAERQVRHHRARVAMQVVGGR